jgi:hypothetical protein
MTGSHYRSCLSLKLTSLFESREQPSYSRRWSKLDHWSSSAHRVRRDQVNSYCCKSLHLHVRGEGWNLVTDWRIGSIVDTIRYRVSCPIRGSSLKCVFGAALCAFSVDQIGRSLSQYWQCAFIFTHKPFRTSAPHLTSNHFWT